MSNNRQKIASFDVDVYAAPAGTNPTDISLWQLLGWCEAGTVRLYLEKTYYQETNKKQLIQLAQKYIFTATLLETDLAKITFLESRLNKYTDILLKVRTEADLYIMHPMFKVFFAIDFRQSPSRPRRIPITAQRIVKKPSNLFYKLVIQPPAGEVPEVDLYGDIDFESGV